MSHTKGGQLLKREGYSLQSNRKTKERKQHPERNAQFEYINRRVKAMPTARANGGPERTLLSGAYWNGKASLFVDNSETKHTTDGA
jgi:hypothetical protein